MGLDDLFQGAGDGNGISSGEGSSFADGFTPGGGFASNDGISTGLSDAAWGISSGGASGVNGDFLQRDPAGSGYSPPAFIGQDAHAQTLEVRNPAGGYPPPGVISQHPSAQTLEARAPGFANMGGASGKGLFPSLAGLGGGSGLGGSLLTPAQPGRPSFGPLTDQPPFGSLADKPSFGSPADQPSFGSLTDQPSMSSLASLAGGGIRSPWNSGGGSGTAAIGKLDWGHDGRLPDDVRYSTSAIGDPMGLFGQPKNAQAIGNSEPGQGGASYGADPFGPSANKFVNSYEATAGEKKEPEYQPHWSTQALLTPGIADASGVGGSQGGIKPTSGDKMIASYEAAQGLQGEGGVLLAAAKAGKTATDAGGAPNTAPGGQTPGGQPNSSPQPKQTDAERFPMRPGLGDQVKREESGKKGVGAVSSGKVAGGKTDAGGVSYGTYQLTSMDKKGTGGTVASFLKSPEGKQFAGYFNGLTPGSPEFTAAWNNLARNKPTEFEQAQKGYLYRENYLPAAKVAAEMGFNMNNFAVQEAVWSGALQSGGFRYVLAKAKEADPHLKFRSPEDQIKALYWARGEYASQSVPWENSWGRYFGHAKKQPGEVQPLLEYNKRVTERH